MATKKVVSKAKATPKSKPTANTASKKLATPSKPYTKTEILKSIASLTGLAKNQVDDVISSLGKIIEVHLKKGAPGLFTLPGLLKCQVVHKPATRARKGINPFTKEETVFKAKPARNLVKIKALKRLKDMV